MRGTADMLRALRKRRFGMLFSIVTGLMVSLTAAPARAADLDLPTDEKILEALKAERLTRCLHAGNATEMRRSTIAESTPEKPSGDVGITFDHGSTTLPREGNFVCGALP
jgi:hypothetical protein